MMLHACLNTICFVFYYTSWRFYAFSRTNLLMRCHSASVFVFHKNYTGNILGIGRNKSQNSYFSRSVTESKGETEWCQVAAAPRHGMGHPLVAPGCGVGPWPTLWRRPSAYTFPSMGKHKGTSQFSSKHTASHCRLRREIGRIQKLLSEPCQRGESPPEAFFITMLSSGVMHE
jgi:hypothetical protein